MFVVKRMNIFDVEKHVKILCSRGWVRILFSVYVNLLHVNLLQSDCP